MSRFRPLRLPVRAAPAAGSPLRRFLLRWPRLFVRLFSPDDGELGQLGEEIAARHLARRGWRILARRLRTRSGEADLVVRSGDALVVVEVKTARSSPLPRPRGTILRESLPDGTPDDIPESFLGGALLRWRPGARCDAKRLARLRAVGREIEADPAFPSASVKRSRRPRVDLPRPRVDLPRPRVDLIEVWLSEPGRRFRLLHHEDLERPLS